MQSNWNFHICLMGMQTSTAMPLCDNSVAVSYNIKHTFTI